MKKSEVYRAAEAVVRSLEVPCSNLSMWQLIYGLELLHMDSELIHGVTTRLYPKIAEMFPDANGVGVERNLRAARDRIMDQGNRDRLEEMLGHPVRYSLSVADLLDGIGFYLDRNGLWPDE